MRLRVREFIPGDEMGILQLFNITFRRPLDINLWKWRYLESPYGKGVIRLMFDNDTLVGHYAVNPMPLFINGAIETAAISMTTMTHPDYSGCGIFTQLASDAYEGCRQAGIKIVFGFPNENSYPGFTGKLNWKGFGHILGFEASWQRCSLSIDPSFTLKEMKTSDAQIDHLWGKVKRADRIMAPRTTEFVDWRYFQKPGNEYHIYGLFNTKQILEGMLVLKLLKQGKRKIGNIVDFISPDEQLTQKSLLAGALGYFMDNNTKEIKCWPPKDKHLITLLHEEGFIQKEWPTYFGIKILSEEHKNSPLVNDKYNWSMQMGESDVF